MTSAHPHFSARQSRAANARLFVVERTGLWAIALRDELGGGKPRLYETRSLAECWAMLEAAPASFVVAELTAGQVDPLLERMAHLPSDFPDARIAVVADRALVAYEWLMREAGAVHFATSPRQLAPIAMLAKRHLRQAFQPAANLVDQIWDNLPWRNQSEVKLENAE